MRRASWDLRPGRGLWPFLAAVLVTTLLGNPANAAQRLFVVLNPRAGWFNKHPEAIQKIKTLVEKDGSSSSLGKVHVTSSLDDLDRIAKEFVSLQDKENTALIVGGGDGTAHRVFSAIEGQQRGTLENIAGVIPLKGGSYNTLLRNYKKQGLNRNPVSVVGDVVRKIERGEAFDKTELPLLRANDKIGFSFGWASLPKLLRKSKGKFSVRKGLQTTVSEFLKRGDSYRPVRTRIRTGNMDETRNITFGFASPYRIAGITRPFDKGKSKLGRISLVASSFKPWQILLRIWRAFFKRPISKTNPHHIDKNDIESVDLKFKGDYVIDNELHKGGTSHVGAHADDDENDIRLEVTRGITLLSPKR